MVVLGVPPDRLRRFSRRISVTVTVDGTEWFTGKATTVVVATGEFRDGLDLVPRGHPGDGRVEVQVYALAPRERAGMRARARGRDPPAAPAHRPADRPARRRAMGARRVPAPDRAGRPAPGPDGSSNDRGRCRGVPIARLTWSGARGMRADAGARRYHRQSHAVRAGDVHRTGSSHPPAVLHESRRTGLRAHEPSRGREGRAVRSLLALGQEPAPPVPRRVRRRSRPHRRPDRRRDRSVSGAPKSCTHGSSSNTATTRSRSWVACTSPASRRRTC